MPGVRDKISTYWSERFRFQLKTLWDILWEARLAFSRDGCMNLSAALAFYTILSLIPLLFLLISATGYILGSSDNAYQLAKTFFDQLFPQTSMLIFQEVKAISQRAGLLGSVGFLSMIWTASVIFSSLEYAMGVVFRVERERKYINSKLLALSMIPASALILLLSIFATAFSETMGIKLFGLYLTHSAFIKFLIGYLIPYLILALAFTAIYKIIPNTAIALHHAAAGGALCAFLFEIAKHFFTWYIGRSPSYNVIYGSLEAMVILVVWVFYSSCILLFCAEVVSAYRRRDITLLGKAFL